MRSSGPALAAAAVAAWTCATACPGPQVAPEGEATVHQRAGLACAADLDCGLDRCERDLFPGGACVGTCDSARACPHPDGTPAQVCLGDAGTGGCLRGCEADGGCARAGWLCQATGGAKVCLPHCRDAPALCGAPDGGRSCNDVTGLCQAPLPADAGLYGLCGVSAACAGGGECLSLAGQAGQGGICTAPCGDGGSCPGSGACLVEERQVDGGTAGRCAMGCAGAGPCAAGSCQQFQAGTEADGGARWVGICAP